MPMVAEAKRRLGKPVDDPAQESRVQESALLQVRAAAQAAGRPAPEDAAVVAFWQAQFAAAKTLQRRAHGDPSQEYSLETELRPALARIGTKLAWLLVRIPGRLRAADIRARARAELAETGLPAQSIELIAGALSRVSASVAAAPVRCFAPCAALGCTKHHPSETGSIYEVAHIWPSIRAALQR
jgi:cyclohexadienyl dehydratase